MNGHTRVYCVGVEAFRSFKPCAAALAPDCLRCCWAAGRPVGMCGSKVQCVLLKFNIQDCSFSFFFQDVNKPVYVTQEANYFRNEG